MPASLHLQSPEGGEKKASPRSVDGGATYLPALDGLRGIAILAVMLFHFLVSVGVKSMAAKLAVACGSWGWMGVDLFFVLSGFLITGILLRTKSSANYLSNFYMRRFLRIFPLYYGALFVLFVILPRFAGLDSASRSVYALQGWLWTYSGNIETAVHHRFSFDGGWYQLSHLWSLAVEEQFYLVWPFVVWAISEGELLRASIAICIAIPILRAFLVAWHVFPGTLYMLTICRVDALVMGAVLAIWFRRPDHFEKAKRWTKPLVAGGIGFVLVSFAARRAIDEWHWSMATIGYSMVDLGCAGLLLGALGEGTWPRVLDSQVLRTLGKYSYGTYLIHWTLHGVFRQVFFESTLRATDSELLALSVYVPASIGISVLAAFAVCHLYERPFLRLKRFFEYRRAPARSGDVRADQVGQLN